MLGFGFMSKIGTDSAVTRGSELVPLIILIAIVLSGWMDVIYSSNQIRVRLLLSRSRVIVVSFVDFVQGGRCDCDTHVVRELETLLGELH